jgi:hypothetical protein
MTALIGRLPESVATKLPERRRVAPCDQPSLRRLGYFERPGISNGLPKRSTGRFEL